MTADQSGSSNQAAAGIAAAVTGHVVAAAPFLYTVFYLVPDSVFMVAWLTGTLELVLFVVCMALGFGLRPTSPNLAMGVLSGWVFGLIAIPCGGTAAIGFIAVLV
ncbi:hypothetical protein KZ829_07910 [Actinoplanes hulinensis]|uniref:Uncharacterized protein n=1 Tax=Actinoplanes hulinensis TaxID=1144547 RepID=A0ABS7AY26_9ACTN|nr:hypothetical protein [Actinoplanes hulinensis]MBW6433666.1 hypothetical protein [Actinoplanes hulinensis]